MNRRIRSIMAVMLALAIACGPFGSLTVKADEVQPAAPVVRWAQSGGYYYCYLDGVKQTGIVTLSNNSYYFDSNGRQQTGWRKIGSDYYYFRIANGASGYMIKNKRVNGVKLTPDGRANVRSKHNKRKAKIMARCSVLMDAASKPTQSTKVRLKRAWKYLKKHYRKRAIHHWKGGREWDLYYAEYMLNHRAGDCYCFGTLYAYFANAVGCKKVVAVSSGHHGWCKVNGKVYDPSWSFAIGDKKCYAVKSSLGGTGGRLASEAAAHYKKVIQK